MSKALTLEERAGCEAALFEWVESYDTKDWARLGKAVAPTLKVDYSSFLNRLWEAMPAEDFVKMASDPHFLGNPKIKTQHFIGLSTWQKTGDDTVTGHHQVRVAHQKYSDDALQTVAVKGHNHGGAKTWYKKIDGTWKFAGVGPEARWFEFDYDQIFVDSKAEFDKQDA